MAKATKRAQSSRLARAAARPSGSGPRRGSRRDALELIFETAHQLGEGFRTGALGAPRMGKTYHVQEVVTEAVRAGLADFALVHDTKRAEAQYAGTVRASVGHLVTAPPGPQDSPIVVIHPGPADPRPTVEECARLALDVAKHGQAVCLLVDELYKGLKSRMTWDGPSIGEVFREGSSQGVSCVWTTQIPQSLPTEALDLSETVALFNLSGRSLSYAVDAFRLPPAAAALLPRLGRGEFLLTHANHEWDGTVYGPK